ncbi:hypothetical protein [Rubrivirga sp. IMCC45206]|uniref:hypothetical protein n=1 Tax=Rubrivirga sp. IMCC45206 TaxID=3391614 RepID=UPI00398FC845
MILRRLTQHVRDQNWTAVAIDFVIVVVGVAMGFQVTAWGSERAERAREQVLLRGLRADMVENRATYARVAEIRDLHMRQLRDLHALTEPNPPEPDPTLFDSLLSAFVDWQNLDPTVGRINAVLGSGQISLVRSDSLQAALARWPTVLANMEENEQFVAELLTKRVIPYLATRYPVAVVDARAGLIEPVRPNAFPAQRRALLADLEFSNLVEERWVQTRFIIADGEPVRELIETLLRLLDAEIQR